MTRLLSTYWPVPILAVVAAVALLGPRLIAGSSPPAGAPTPATNATIDQAETSAIAPAVAASDPTPPVTPAPTVAPATPATAAATATPASTPTPARAASAASRKPIVLGYYVPYDATSWASFQARAAALDYVAAQWVTVDACGNLGSRDDRTLIAYARERGVKVLPSLLTSSGWLNHRLLTDPATTDRFLSQIVGYVVEADYPGFDLDLEGINAEDRDAYTSFVARLAEALHKRGKILTLAIPAKFSDVRTGWAGPYDYAALGKHADLILLMTYDYSWSSGPPGSIAPRDWVDKVAAYAVSQMPAEKVLIGLAFYAYDWNVTQGGRARALLYPQADALARQYGARIATDQASLSGTFTYTARAGDKVPPPPAAPALQHDVAVRTPGPCSVRPPSPTPGPAVTPRPTPTPAPLQRHVVWLEDATSVASKLQVAGRYAVGGVGAWRLGQEDPEVWKHLESYRSGK